MSYCGDTEFIEYVQSEIAADQTQLLGFRDAAEQAINQFCGRSFAVSTGVSATRTYRPTGYGVITHDFVDTTGLAMTLDGTTVAVADCEFEPLNSVSWTGLSQPIYKIVPTRGPWYSIGNTAGSRFVVTTAKWGWPAIPDVVVEATKILGKDIAHVRQNRFGVAGFGEFGVVRVRDNPHVHMLLQGLQHPASIGIAG